MSSSSDAKTMGIDKSNDESTTKMNTEPAGKLQTNSIAENLIDNNSSGSSSSDPKLKIDIDEEAEATPKITPTDNSTDPPVNSTTKHNSSKKEAQEDLNETSSSINTLDSSSVRGSEKRRIIHRGLDGGYWSRISMGEMISENKPKRTRHGVDRLNISVNFDDEEFSTPTGSKRSSRSTRSEPLSRNMIYAPKSFLTVRNETGSFFLCQSINKIYENSKRCRVQWLEGENDANSYYYGSNDWIDPNSIISKVDVKKIGDKTKIIKPKEVEVDMNQSFFEIVKDDLATVTKLLKIALTDGGIPPEIVAPEKFDTDSEIEEKPKKKADEILNDKDYYDNEDTDSDQPIKKAKTKTSLAKKLESSSSGTSSSESESILEPTVAKKIRIKSPTQKKPKSFEEYRKQLLKGKSENVPKPKSIIDEKKKNGTAASSVNHSVIKPVTNSVIKPVTNSVSEQPKKKTSIQEIPNDLANRKSTETFKLGEKTQVKSGIEIIKKHKVDEKRPKIPETGGRDEKLKSAMKPSKVVNKSGSDTDQMDSDSETVAKKVKKKEVSPKETINTKKMPPQDNANSVTAVSRGKKRHLFKVISNRYLDPNPKVTVFAKDPFFEEANNEAEIPFISAYVQSKLAFKALHLGDLTMLKRLIDDVEHVPSVHVGKSLCSKWIPAEYALYLENKEALSMLIDNFVAESVTCNKKTRVQMPETMFQKFSNGAYNTRSLGVPFTRKLTEARGVKEGNSAFIKDTETISFVHSRSPRMFFKRLFDLALEHGSSIEFFDFLLAKWKSCDSVGNARDRYFHDSNENFIYESVIQAILFGHRRLAGHILENAPNGHGFNAVHVEVLKADNDEDLKCKLRANMCTKKPFSNDLVTPIHCACINPNVKYLKTLLSITQEYNIADKRGRKPIHYAAVCEGLSPLEYLISRVSPYEMDSAGCIPLHYACLAGRSVNVEMLLSHARLKQEDDSTVTTEIIMDNKYGLGGLNKPNRRAQLPIHLAISRNNYDCVKVLVKYGCNLEYPLPNSMGKITPLMYACQLGHQKIVQLLIDNSVKIEARDRHQRTATIHAAMCGHSRTLSYLLRLGANPNVCDSSGNSCLHYACAYGWYYCVKVLLDAGAQINVLNDWKLTPFGTAFLKGHVGLCDQLLILYPKQIDINFRTEDGETLVMLSVSSAGTFNKASVDQLQYIVTKLGGNCSLTDSKGSNAFHYLASNLIDRQAIKHQFRSDVVNREQLEEDSFQEQCKFRNKIAEILLKSGCNPNAENSEFETPFFTAVASSNVSFARYLLEKVDVKITARQSPNGNTLLSLMAEKFIDLDICSIIQHSNEHDQKNIIPYQMMAKIRNENGLTPFQIACIKLKEAASKLENDQEHINKFLKFLLLDCQSEPNNSIIATSSPDKPIHYFSAENTASINYTSVINTTTYELKPISFLLYNRHTQLVADFIKEQSKSQHRIEFTGSVNENGLSPLLQACKLKQTEVLIKIIDTGVLSVDEICKLHSWQKINEKSEIDESVLQLAVRYEQADLFEACVDELIRKGVAPETMVKLLKHVNLNKQNFMHLLTGLSDAGRAVFNSSRLSAILDKLRAFFKPGFDFWMLVSELLAAKDKLDRSVIHSALINFHTQKSNNINLEMFLLDQIFTLAPSQANLNAHKHQIFCTKDTFGRLPIHYLFYDSNRFETNDLTEVQLYQLKTPWEKITKPNKSVYFGKDYEKSSTVIDPVEILTVVIKQMENKFLDEQDLAGFTPLHYAAVRGATIACMLLVSNKCCIFKSDNMGNTPISSGIYYERQTCVLALLRSMNENLTKTYSLKNHYYFHERDLLKIDGKYEEENAQEPNLEWERNPEKNLYPYKKVSLYKLILLNEWEGISWLILGELNNYGLNQFDVIHAACMASEFSIAVRLLDRYMRNATDPLFANKLCSHVFGDTKNTFLHEIADRDIKASLYEPFTEFLTILFKPIGVTVTPPDQSVLKSLNTHGTTAMHYACHMQNFAYIDFMLSFFKDRALELLTCKDSANQTAYSLLFWQIGRVEYTTHVQDKIKSYTNDVIKKSGNIEFISRAYFPLTDNFLEINRTGKLLSDYPSPQRDQLVSPLIYGLNRQDFNTVKFLIKGLEFNVNTCDSKNQCALVYAIQTNNIRMCQLLLNVDFNSQSDLDQSKASTEKTASKFLKAMKLPKRIEPDSDPDMSDDEDNNDESLNLDETRDEDTSTNQTKQDLAKFEVKSNIILNQQDNKQLSIFHHLASGLEYGSFHNVEICQLLFAAFNYLNSNKVDGVNNRVLPSLPDFLKRIDSKMLTASDYALKNGNLPLYGELEKCMNPDKVIPDNLPLNKFTVVDQFYEANSKPDYQADSAAFVSKATASENGQKSQDFSECFQVDDLSNMNKTGSIVWDEPTSIPYDVVLTKTDVTYGLYGMHNFYKLQLISLNVKNGVNQNGTNGSVSKFDPNQMCVLFTRWGRIGDQGQCQRTPFANFKEARDEFCKIFKQKTANDFIDTVLEKKKQFESKPKRYSLVKLEYRKRQKLADIKFDLFSNDADKQAIFGDSVFSKNRNYMEFFSDLLSVDYIKKKIDYSQLSTEYIPITKLSFESITAAGAILNKKLKPAIERRMELEKLNKKENLPEYMGLLDQINKLSNEYYDLIPQMKYNYEKLQPISTEHEFDQQLMTINKLTNAHIAVRILMGAKMGLAPKNPFDYVYRSLNIRLEIMNVADQETQYVLRYISPSLNKTVGVKRIFKFERPGEMDRFEKNKLPSGCSKQTNRWLLWHGTGTENMISIMSKGLIKAPNDAKHTGYRFGKGIYFSDSFAVSSSYASGIHAKTESGEVERKYMLLCEVALGKVKELQTQFEAVDSLPKGFDSVKAVGNEEPNPAGNISMPNGAIIPLGAPINTSRQNGGRRWQSFANNQYIVYNESQVVIRYIVQYYD